MLCSERNFACLAYLPCGAVPAAALGLVAIFYVVR